MKNNDNTNKEKKMYEELYILQELSTRDIAKELNVSQSTVRRKLEKYNIRIRTSKEGQQTEKYRQKLKELSDKLKVTEVRDCVVCGEKFEVKPHEKKKICSKKCFGKYFSDLHTHKVETQCAQCGKKLMRIPNRIKVTKNQFCNNECHGAWKSNNLVGEDNPTYNRINTNCGYCEKELSVIPALYRNRIKKYCNATCMRLDYIHSGRFRGEKSGTWKGGRYSYGENWHTQRNIVRERDGYKCIKCGITENDHERQMSVHHIKSFRLFDDYKAANDINNLVCLCAQCHRFVHSNKNIEKEFIDEG